MAPKSVWVKPVVKKHITDVTLLQPTFLYISSTEFSILSCYQITPKGVWSCCVFMLGHEFTVKDMDSNVFVIRYQ